MISKTLLMFLAFFILITTSESQIVKQYGFKIGASSSYQTATTFINNEKSSSENRIGFDAGVFIEIFNNKNINLLAELHFIQKGMKFVIDKIYNIPEKTGESEYTTINYLSFPLLVKLGFSSKILSPYLLAGPRADYMLSYSENILNGYYKSINKINWGITIGVGISRKLTKKSSLLAEFRYCKDFTSFPNTEFHVGSQLFTYGNKVGVNIKNSSFEFLIGLGF